MSAKRKDKKGRVLRTGESQRKDLSYQYRYTDAGGKRHTVYSPTLDASYAHAESSMQKILQFQPNSLERNPDEWYTNFTPFIRRLIKRCKELYTNEILEM